MKILLHAPNITGLTGMEQLARMARKRGIEAVILLEIPFKLRSNTKAIELENFKKKAWYSGSKALLLRAIKSAMKFYFNPFHKSDGVKRPSRLKENIWVFKFYEKKKRVMAILDELQPDAIYVYGDRHDGYEPSLIQAANERLIPVIIPPIAYGADKETLLLSIKRTSKSLNAHDVTHLTSFKSLHEKQWVHDESTGRDISYYPPWIANARHRCGALPANPWSLGGGFSDFICIPGERERRRFSENGVPRQKIRITGYLNEEHLFFGFSRREELRKKISRKYFHSERNILIVALPQLLEHSLASEAEHWNVQFEICNAAQRIGWNVLISLHPKMDREKYASFLKPYRFSILDERLHEVLPVADIFLVGQGSSTIPWSVLCEVPLVIMDWYGLSFKVSDWIEGKVVIKNARDLWPALRKLSRIRRDREIMRAAHRGQKKLVSPFDGKSLERVFSAGRPDHL